MPERPSTPPRAAHSGALPKSPLTPEQVRRIEENRLRAKALLRTQDEAAARRAGASALNLTPNGFIAGQKRPFSSISASNTPSNHRDARNSPQSAGKGASSSGGLVQPKDDGIRAVKKFDKYIEYDFSKMTDTKGGFLSSADDPHNRALHAPNQEDKPAHMTLAEWERHQLIKKLRAQKAGPFEPGISVLNANDEGKTCRECGSLEIDWGWQEVFGCCVCNACKERLPDKYSLLTKTEAKEDYLLTDPELKDASILPHLEKPNPHKSTWNNMQLYLRFQVEEYAFSDRKWGSPEALDAEFEKRESEKKRRKQKKFDTKLAELKKKTRVDAYKRSRNANGSGPEANFGDRIVKAGEKHVHEWGRTVEDPETGIGKKKCVECGMEVEELEF